MRKLAQALGVEAMSLYNHVSNKDDVLDGIADLVVAEIEVPEIGGDWRQALRKRAVSAHAVLRRRPWSPLLTRLERARQSYLWFHTVRGQLPARSL